jgi:hypothetical protein
VKSRFLAPGAQKMGKKAGFGVQAGQFYEFFGKIRLFWGAGPFYLFY